MISNVKIIMEKNRSGSHIKLEMATSTCAVLYVVTLSGS